MNNHLRDVIRLSALQKKAFEQREKTRAEKIYGAIMENAAEELRKFTQTASFDEILAVEKIFQENDIHTYVRSAAALQAVQQGIDDLKDGEEVYRQLLHDTEAYEGHRYRKSERAAPDRIVPLDAMRKALRGQAARVENYRKNVMGNVQEQIFLAARVAMLRRAEKLYDGIQRDRLFRP